jgi:hypothetical protein
MPDESKKTGVDITFNIDKQGENFRISWKDLYTDDEVCEDAVAELVGQMRERFVAMAQVSGNLDEAGQASLKELCGIFAPEKLAESGASE